jgi:hypothetical protein
MYLHSAVSLHRTSRFSHFISSLFPSFCFHFFCFHLSTNLLEGAGVAQIVQCLTTDWMTEVRSPAEARESFL